MKKHLDNIGEKIFGQFIKPEDLDDRKRPGFDLVEYAQKVQARAATSSELRAATVLNRINGNASVGSLLDELRTQLDAVHRGDMKQPEAMLLSQANVLEALFSDCAIRSIANAEAGYVDAAERYLRVALKAQMQAARTLEVLGNLKNPKSIAFVNQANIAHGPQQVNNETYVNERGRARNGKPKNEQSGECDGVHQNSRAPSTAISSHSTLEAVGTIDRAKVRWR